MRALVFSAIALAACATPRARTSGVSPVRFANLEPSWVVDDRRPVADQPAEREHTELRGFDLALTWRIDRALDGQPDRRAIGVNSLGAVPTSTWFENRVGVREVSALEVKRGAGDGSRLDLSGPLRIVKGKSVGARPGFYAEDASGVRWLIKPEPGTSTESATDVAAARLFWLIGYHVPDDQIAYLERAEVVLDDGAMIRDADGTKRPMTEADVDAVFARSIPDHHGRFRVLASRLLPGTPIGVLYPEGVRDDDPNDTIPHERRRELRGLGVFAAWLAHVDFKELNTLDTWQEDPLDPSRKVVFHYLLDFGNALGMYVGRDEDPATARPDHGHVEQAVDLTHLASFFSFGLWRRPWEGIVDPGIPGVGRFDVEHYDPAGFKPFQPFTPFLEADAADAFWAVEILLRITPEHIRAALEAAEYPDPRAVDHLETVLIGRQRKTARHWLERTSPLSDLAVTDDGRICFDDLAVRHDLAGDGTRSYRASTFDWAGAPLGEVTLAGRGSRRCTAVLPLGADHDAYTIIRLDVATDDRALPPLEVHVARAPSGSLRVIGLVR